MKTETKILWLDSDTRGIIVVNGYRVPNVIVIKHTNPANDGLLALQCEPIGWQIDVTEDEVIRWGNWIAQAMAGAAGYTCHGEGSMPLNPYCRRMICIDEPPSHECS